MSPSELAQSIEDAIVAADVKFAKRLTNIQTSLYDDLLIILKDLELEDGYIKQSAANRKILDQAELKVYETYQSSTYTKAVSDYLMAVPKIDNLNQEYFSDFVGFKENRVFLKSLQQQSVSNVETYILQDGLEAQVISPLTNIMNQNINSGGKFSGFLQQIQDYVQGNSQVESRALSYSRVYLKNTLFQYSRSYQQSLTDDLKLEFYLYSGGLIDRSREFCIERAGNYFHHREIENWASLKWKGKDPLTTESSIFILCGGYSCGHQLIPVARNVVPDDVIERAEKAGYVN